MRISTSMRWLVVFAGAIMLLAVVAACSSETIEVPGETVVVEKEVIKTVEVPGETVIQEVVKEVQVPGETVVVEKVVTETVEVPGETVVVKEEVVKTVEVPGETVTVEVVKEVMVPGETVVVEKEVVKTVEVPGETVVVTKEVAVPVEVVREVPGKKYVTDPTTGEVVVAPEYGGTLTYVKSIEPANIDPYFRYSAGVTISGVNEKLGMTNWGIDRDVYAYRTTYNPEFTIIERLAESWEQPDPTTYIFHIRPGVHWHDKPPMNGRELTADDIKYHFERILGLGDFAEAGHGADLNPGYFNVESIEATDKYTVVFKLKSITVTALEEIVIGRHSYIMAREVVEQHGDVTDWKNVVGTGPFMLTDYVEGSSLTYVKNPDYWGYDEKYPENRLPYVDELRALISKEPATILALMRSGKADYIGNVGDSHLRTIDEAVSLQRTNPEMNLWPWSFRATGLSFNVQKPPWNDVMVRHAIQMAIDLETINDTYFRGWADTTPAGQTGINLIGYHTPFAEWPEEIKQYYRYDPEGAEALLDEAGYPRGADGVRFSTVYDHPEFGLDYTQIVLEYLRAIGIGVEVRINDRTTNTALVRDHQHQGLIRSSTNNDYPVLAPIYGAYSKAAWNPPNANDPVFDAMYDAAEAATTIEEQMRLHNEADMYIIEKHWWIAGPRVPSFNVTQPWLIGYNGEIEGNLDRTAKFARLWIDSELKEAMGR